MARNTKSYPDTSKRRNRIPMHVITEPEDDNTPEVEAKATLPEGAKTIVDSKTSKNDTPDKEETKPSADDAKVSETSDAQGESKPEDSKLPATESKEAENKDVPPEPVASPFQPKPEEVKEKGKQEQREMSAEKEKEKKENPPPKVEMPAPTEKELYNITKVVAENLSKIGQQSIADGIRDLISPLKQSEDEAPTGDSASPDESSTTTAVE